MADTNEPENIYATGGPTNDTEPTSVYIANPNATTSGAPTTTPQTDQYDADYNNPPLSTVQVGITQEGTVIPNYTEPMPQPVNVTDLTDFTNTLFSSITSPIGVPKELANTWFQGVSMTIHLGPESFAIGRINLAYPNYITFAQLQELGQSLLSQIQSNPTEFLVHYDNYGKNQTLLTEMALSQVTGITLVGYKFNWLDPNTPPPVYT